MRRGSLERFQPDCAVDPGRFARGTGLRLLAMARHVASTRLVPQANRLGLASHSQAESALVRHALLLVLMLAACGSPLKERFYTLSSSGVPEPAASGPSYRLAVGPVTIPAVVDRPQIVLRAGANRVTLAEESRWAEPLKDSIPRVIAGNLAVLLSRAQVAASSQGAAAAADYRVLLDVQRFDSALGDAATLEVLWTVGAVTGDAATGGRSLIREPAGDTDYDALVAAHNRALAAVSRDIAAAVREVKRVSQAAPLAQP